MKPRKIISNRNHTLFIGRYYTKQRMLKNPTLNLFITLDPQEAFDARFFEDDNAVNEYLIKNIDASENEIANHNWFLTTVSLEYKFTPINDSVKIG